MVTFEPTITLGPIIVWVTVLVMGIMVFIRVSRELRRADMVDARLELLQDQIDRLKAVVAGRGEDDEPGAR